MTDLKQKAEEYVDRVVGKGRDDAWHFGYKLFLAGASSQAAEIERLRIEGFNMAEKFVRADQELHFTRAELEACRSERNDIRSDMDAVVLEYQQIAADLQSSRDQVERYRNVLELVRDQSLLKEAGQIKTVSGVNPHADIYAQVVAALPPDGRPSEMREAVEKVVELAQFIFDLRDQEKPYDQGQHWPDLYHALAAYRKARGGV